MQPTAPVSARRHIVADIFRSPGAGHTRVENKRHFGERIQAAFSGGVVMMPRSSEDDTRSEVLPKSPCPTNAGRPLGPRLRFPSSNRQYGPSERTPDAFLATRHGGASRRRHGAS